LEVAVGFQEHWNFPHCVGALDGKHVVIVKPSKSGSIFRNYKQTFSIVLMAIVDANYRFIYANVGAQGRMSDGGVYSQCTFSSLFDEKALGLPDPSRITDSEIIMPYVLVADEAFPLKSNIMKPYPRRKLSNDQRIFNYRLSRARRVVENAFGIMSSKFRVYRSPIALKTSSVRLVVMATVCLHNFIRQYNMKDHSEDLSETGNEETMAGDEDDNDDIRGLRAFRSKRGRNEASALQLRKQLTQHFTSTGAVPWQWKAAGLPAP
jgi:hypothetical protein